MTDAEKLAQREILSKCLDLSVETMLDLGNAILAKEKLDDRLEVLLASILTASNRGRAIKRLHADRPFAEAMHILLRSLAELVITASYLQIASEAELNSYLKYDTLMLEKSLRLTQEIKPDFLGGASPEDLDKFGQHAEKVKLETQDVVSGTSWTKTVLHDRALQLDNKYKIDIFSFLSRVVYSSGHSYTHSTFGSMQSQIEFLRSGEHDDEATKESAELAVFGTAQALHYFNLFIALNQNEDLPNITVVHDLMDTYDKNAHL